MKIRVSQKKVSLNYEYEIAKDGELCYTAQARRVVWPFFRKIVIRDASGAELPYQNHGWIREWFKLGQPHAKALLRSNQYMIYGHSGNTYSVYRGSVQIGSIKRDPWKTGDGDKSNAESDNDTDPLISVIHILFADVTWHTTDLELWAKSYETNITFGGIKDNSDWKPKAR